VREPLADQFNCELEVAVPVLLVKTGIEKVV
jgi:hypothetical protein